MSVELLPILIDLAGLALLGGFIGLDRRGAFQLMISQPLPAVALLGWIAGEPALGLWMGGLLQLLWSASFLFGANIPPNETIGALTVGGVVLLYQRHLGPADGAVQGLAFLAAVPASLVGRFVDIRLDRGNSSLVRRADAAAQAGRSEGIAIAVLLGLWRTWATTVLQVLVLTGAGLALVGLARPWLTLSLAKGVSVVATHLVPALGVAVILTTIRQRSAVALAALSFAALAVVLSRVGGAQ